MDKNTISLLAGLAAGAALGVMLASVEARKNVSLTERVNDQTVPGTKALSRNGAEKHTHGEREL